MATTNPAAQTAGALGKAFGDLSIPGVLGWMFISALTTLVAAIGLWYLLDWLLLGYEFFNWGWVNWLLDFFGGIAIFFLVLLLMPTLLVLITTMFLDYVVSAVEKRHYPHLPAAREMSYAEIIGYGLKFTGLIIVVNLIALPFYLLLPVLNIPLAWTINGYLVGREFFELVALRRMDQRRMREERRANGGRIFSGGFILAMLMTVPILNLIMPVIAACYFTHIFHALPIDYPGKRRA